MSDRVQKMARVNVDPDAWATLRIHALRTFTTLADRLGELVEREADRIRRSQPGRDHQAKPLDGGDRGTDRPEGPPVVLRPPPHVRWIPPSEE